MPPPALLLSFFLASLYGFVFYFIFGHGWLRLVSYWLVALVGFALGQSLAAVFTFSLFPIGSVNVIEASATSFIALLLTRAVWRK